MKKKYKLILFSIGIILILTLFIGTSYSLWKTTNSQDTVNVVSTKCFNVEITSEKNSIALENTYPITNEKGKKLIPYSFTITNTCDVFASYQVNLESLKSTTLSSKFLDVMINNEEIKKLSEYESTDTINTGSIESHILAKGSLGSGDSVDYALRLWIDYDTTMEDLDNETKSLKSKIVVISQPSNWSPVSAGYDTLREAILANEYQTSPEVAIKKIEAKGTPDLSQTAPLIEWKEKIGDEEVKEIIKPDKSILGNKSLGTEKLDDNASLILVGTDYTFNKKTGNYTLVEPQYVDPTLLNFDSNYYFCGGGTEISKTDDRINVYDYSNDCQKFYKINNVAKNNSGEINTKYYRVVYTLYSTKMEAIENEADSSDKGLYQSEDDFGLTYYYRGNVNNNIVYFAGFYWKIIRINGDNSIRLLYNGDGINTDSIGTSAFNENSNPAYVGYMYGKNIGTRENNIKNEVNSIIKSKIDNWYKINISSNYENYLAVNAGFCGDRSISSGDGYSSNIHTIYGPYGRYLNHNANFKCSDIDNDFYTTASSNTGNKVLTYPIGLITYDELAFAGMNENVNVHSYVFSKSDYWTISPSKYDMYYKSTFNFSSNNKANFWGGISLIKSVRPVINLKADVEITGGIGTINDPYIVKTE